MYITLNIQNKFHYLIKRIVTSYKSDKKTGHCNKLHNEINKRLEDTVRCIGEYAGTVYASNANYIMFVKMDIRWRMSFENGHGQW